MFDFLKRSAVPEASVQAKASATGPIVARNAGMFGTGRAAWSPRDTVSLTRAGFQRNPVGFRCVKMIAEAGAALPLVLSDAERRYDVHPLLALLGRPNPAQGRADLLEALIAQMLLSGNGYVEAVGAKPHENCTCCDPTGCVWFRVGTAGRWRLITSSGQRHIGFRWATARRRSAMCGIFTLRMITMALPR